ncbi:MAG: hypothetical protein D6718_08195 [Acidobacteria bacterium]|nr:MAG: hypothetical protein D6718_08195 [Acidobacteriota bacterium]
MAKTSRSFRCLSLVMLAAFAAAATPAAAASTIVAYVDQPVVVGGQVFSGGEIELVPVTGSGVMAVRIDGRQVATMFLEPSSGGGAPALLFRRDARGLLHLVGVRRQGRPGQPPADAILRVAAVARGLATADMPRHQIQERLARR